MFRLILYDIWKHSNSKKAGPTEVEVNWCIMICYLLFYSTILIFTNFLEKKANL